MDIGFTAWAALAALYALTVALGVRRLRALRADATRAQAALTTQRDAHTDTADAATQQAAEITTLRDTVRALEAACDDAQRAAADTVARYIQCQDDLISAQRAAQTAYIEAADAARLHEDRQAALHKRVRALEAQVTQLTDALASAQRAAQAANAPTPDAARLQTHREAALNQRVRALEDALQEAHNRAAQAEAHEGSAAQLQQHIHDLKAKLQALRERERAILKVMQEEVAALNETASRAYARGLVEGVCIDGVISPTEKARVDQWFANNGFPAEWAQRLFQEVQEQYDAQWLASDDPAPPSSDAPAVVSDPAPADKTARLRDLIAATAADGLISYEELRMLQRWAEENGVSAQALRGLLLDAKRAHPGALLIQSSPRALSSKEKGDAFEQYVVSRFRGKHFKLLDWRGDKVTAEGKFALASMLPDLELALCLGNEQHRFAVECKWRSNIGPEGEVTWCREEQLARYRAFEARRGEPVFLVLGLGGMPQEPHGVFAIPLRDLSSPTIGREQLGRYRHDPAKPFYYSPEQRALR